MADLWSPAPYAELQLRLDATGAFFAVLVAGVALAASIFGSSHAHHCVLNDAVYPVFVLSMLLVAAAGNVYTFLVAWEGMALPTFILVIGDGSLRSRRQAAGNSFIYENSTGRNVQHVIEGTGAPQVCTKPPGPYTSARILAQAGRRRWPRSPSDAIAR